MAHNLCYAQSGGVTAVINQSAAGVIERGRQIVNVDTVLAARDGIMGVLQEQMYDCQVIDSAAIRNSPGGFFGSCRFKLPPKFDPSYDHFLQRIVDVFAAHDVRYFLYNGGGDSQDTLLKIAQFAKTVHYPLSCIGIPKTIDNDLPHTDTSPGFGSAAKYLAVSTLEAACDLQAMHATSTKIFILEVMGRNCGWLAAATSLAADVDKGLGPDILLLPEVPFNGKTVLARCEAAIAEKGFCFIVVAEGLQDLHHHHLTKPHDIDAFGHPQLGGIAPALAHYVREHLHYKTHWAVCDYLQRSARHIASATDVAQAYEVGRAAVDMAAGGETDIMATLVREQDGPYRWRTSSVHLDQVANRENPLPAHFLCDQGYRITEAGKAYLRPLIEGESYPRFVAGLPLYQRCNAPFVASRLAAFHWPEKYGL